MTLAQISFARKSGSPSTVRKLIVKKLYISSVDHKLFIEIFA